jgi:PTH1 family peptidyl-tRNA hydrolase
VPVNTKLLAVLWTARGNGDTVHFMKPQTFMNLSGTAVAPFVKTKKIEPAQLIVIHDDIDLPLGKIRVSHNASAGGHNGAQSIITSLGTKEFARVRVGIGRPIDGQQIDEYVLGRFSPEEKAKLSIIIDEAITATEKLFSK